MSSDMRRLEPQPDVAAPEPPRRTPLDAFTRVERERQRDWLFRRHRATRPAWKRD